MKMASTRGNYTRRNLGQLDGAHRLARKRRACGRLLVVDATYQLAQRQRKMLQVLSGQMLVDIQALSKQEDELSLFYPVSAARYRYLIDAVTRGMGQVIEDLTQHWASE